MISRAENVAHVAVFIRNFGRPYSTAFTESSLEVMKACTKDSHASFYDIRPDFLNISQVYICSLADLIYMISIFMVLSKITPRLRPAVFGCMKSPFKLIIISCVRALAKHGEDRIIISIFSALSLRKLAFIQI